MWSDLNNHNAATINRAADEQSLANLLENVTQRLDAGGKVDVDQLADAHPQHAARLRELMPTMVAMASWGRAPAAPLAEKEFGAGRNAQAGVLGDFHIVRELGRGGMGTVFEAEQISMGRKVALKVLPFAALAQEKALQRFRNEVRAAAALDHPHIVAVYSVGEERGIHYYSMQLIRGQSLAAVIQDLRGKLRPRTAEHDRVHSREADPTVDSAAPGAAVTKRDVQAAVSTVADARMQAERFRTAARLGIEAAEALQHAHDQGVLHRDIKPGNLMLDADGKLYVTDFGLARIESDAGMTMTGDIVGTLRYMAPEQALAKRVVIDHRADIYSLGATLYELLTLQPAFGETERSDLLKQIAFEEPAALRKIDRQIPAELETIVLKAMAKNPSERYQAAQQLADDLRAFLESRPIKAKPPTFVGRVKKWSQRHKPLVVSVAAIASTFLVVSVGMLATTNMAIRRERKNTDAALEERTQALQGQTGALAKAEDKAAEANAVLAFLVNDVFGAETGDRFSDHEITLKEVLTRSESKIQNSFVKQPMVEASIRDALGRTYARIGDYVNAEQQYRRSSELCTAHLGPEHAETICSNVDLAGMLYQLGRYDEAPDVSTAALELSEKVFGKGDRVTLIAMETLAWSSARRKRYTEAVELLNRRLQLARETRKADHPTVIDALTDLASVSRESGIDTRNEALYQDAISIKELIQKGQRDPTSALKLAHAFWLLQKSDDSESLYRDVLNSAPRSTHPSALAAGRALGSITAIQGRWREAAGHMDQLMQIAISDEYNVGLDCLRYAPVLVRVGDPEEFEGFRTKVLARFAATENPLTAERISRACLLTPASQAVLLQFDHFHAVLLKGQQGWNVQRPAEYLPWGCLALALLEYRRGNWAASFEWCAKNVPEGQSYRSAMLQSLMTMNAHQLKQESEAGQYFARANDIIKKGYTPGQWSNLDDGWFDWEFAAILRDEARELIERQPAM